VFAPYEVLREQLRVMLRDKADQGRDVSGLAERVDAVPDDYQAIADLADHAGQPHLALGALERCRSWEAELADQIDRLIATLSPNPGV